VNVVAIKYRRFWPFFRKMSVEIPSSWAEINRKQFLLISQLQEKQLDNSKFLSDFTAIPVKILAMMPDYFLWKIGRLLDWITEKPQVNRFFIREIKSGDLHLYSPLNKLKKVTFGQFIFADTAYSDLSVSESNNDLNRLVASLYLPQGEIFSDDLSGKRIPAISKTNYDTRKAIALNYGLVRTWLSEIYPMVFMSGDKNKNQEPQSSSQAWIKAFESIVGDDIVNQDRYADLPVHSVLRYLTKKSKEYYKK